MRMAVKIFARIILHSFVAVLVFAVILLVQVLCFQQEIPRLVLSRVTAYLSRSCSNVVVQVDSASFRFSRGVTVRNLRVLKRRAHPHQKDKAQKLVLSAARVDFDLDLLQFPWRRSHLLRGVTVEGLSYPRLPEGYYVPDSIEYPGEPDFREVDEPVHLDLPFLRPFYLRLERPDILSVAPRYVDIPRVEVTPDGLRAERMRMELADTDARMALEGGMELDLAAQRVRGEVHGLVRQHNVRPMLVAIDITNSYQFIDAFTNIEPPIPASCRYDVNLRNNDLHLSIDLHPQGGRYLGVPLKSTDGNLDIRVFVRDTYQNADIHVNLSDVVLADGTHMDGGIRYVNTNDVGYVDFDVRSETSLSNALDIADALNDGTLESLCITGAPPRVSLKGRLAVKPDRHPQLNDLAGTLAFRTGSLFDIPLRDAETRFDVKGTTVTFSEARARSLRGGDVSGHAVLAFRDCWTPPARFDVDLVCTNIPLADLSEAFGMESEGMNGRLDGVVKLAGLVGTNAVAHLNGGGHVEYRDGKLVQVKVLAGLPKVLSDTLHLSGKPLTLDFTRSRLDFTLSNGVFRTSNMLIEGSVLSVAGAGSYDLVADELDFSVRVNLLKWDWGRALSWVSRPLLDFTVKGSLDDPKWTYSKNPLHLLDRLFAPKKAK